jgi:hypothetical protein
MLRVTKHSDPRFTVLPAAAAILAKLRSTRVLTVAEASDILRRDAPEKAALLMPSIALLYLLGVVEYRRATDTLEYVAP